MRVTFFALLTISIAGCSQDLGRIRDRIEFNDSLLVVQDSIIKMLFLMNKLPKTNRINYFVDANGGLFVNNTKMSSLENARTNQSMRRDVLFLSFSDSEYASFCNLIYYLKRNYISSASFEPFHGEFTFHYREDERGMFMNIRDIVIVEDRDRFLDNLKGRFRILDEKGKLVLIAPL